MRLSINKFVGICAENIDCPEPVYEFGSFIVSGQEHMDLRPYFDDKRYVGSDMRLGPGVDVVLDLHQIDLPSESVGTVLLLETIEHVEYPRKAIEEIYRILRPNGILIISSQMFFPIHAYPSDYWRFTPEGFKSLLKPFASSWVSFAGAEQLPEIVLGIAAKAPATNFLNDTFYRDFDDWKKYWDVQLRPKKPRGFIRFLRFLERTWRKWFVKETPRES